MSHARGHAGVMSRITFQDTANERSEAVFRMLDKDDDGELDEEEFVAGCLRDERLRSLLNSGDGDWKK